MSRVQLPHIAPGLPGVMCLCARIEIVNRQFDFLVVAVKGGGEELQAAGETQQDAVQANGREPYQGGRAIALVLEPRGFTLKQEFATPPAAKQSPYGV